MKTILVDGFNLAFHAYYAMPGLTRKSDGFPLGAIYGWIRMLWRLQDQEKPDRLLVFFDKDGSTRHLALHPEYKANRSETPPDLAQQLPELRRVTALLGFPVLEQSGVEADDLIASAAKVLEAAGETVLIASADKDFAQCVTDKVGLLVPARQPKGGWQQLDAEGVFEKFAVRPEQIVDYLALIGDAVDNIPGLSGVGPKTAARWLDRYGNIDGLLAAREEVVPERFREILQGAEEMLSLNRRLIAFCTDFSGDWLAEGKCDPVGARSFLTEMKMDSTLKEFEKRAGNQLELF